MNKRISVISFLIILNLIFVFELNGQPIANQELKTLFTSADTEHRDYAKPLRESENEINITISTVFLFYKTFISSQDMPTCIFTPSCSEYAVEAFQKKGLFELNFVIYQTPIVGQNLYFFQLKNNFLHCVLPQYM